MSGDILEGKDIVVVASRDDHLGHTRVLVEQLLEHVWVKSTITGVLADDLTSENCGHVVVTTWSFKGGSTHNAAQIISMVRAKVNWQEYPIVHIGTPAEAKRDFGPAAITVWSLSGLPEALRQVLAGKE